ncbi:hypothetical protein HN873_023680, partial [Arachis hypogaea]
MCWRKEKKTRGMLVALCPAGVAQRRSEGAGAPMIPTGGVSWTYYYVTSDVWGTLSR